PIDGSIVPCATGGSLPFFFDDCIKVVRNLRDSYRDRVWTKYSFRAALNPLTGCCVTDVLGIDLDIMWLKAEKYGTGFVWEQFMKNEEAKRGMDRAGFLAASG